MKNLDQIPYKRKLACELFERLAKFNILESILEYIDLPFSFLFKLPIPSHDLNKALERLSSFEFSLVFLYF